LKKHLKVNSRRTNKCQRTLSKYFV